MSSKALIYGTIAIDTLITPSGRANSVLGGSGIYASLAARLLTADMDLVGVVGTDFPAEYGLAMEARGVSMQHVAHVEGETFAWTGKYESDMNNRTTVRTIEGVQEHWKMELSPEQKNCAIAVATNVTPPLQYRMLEQCEGACFRMADFMKSWIIREREYTHKLLSVVDMVLMNDEEAQEYAGTDDSLEAGHKLLEAGPRYAIVKHGSHGSTLLHRAEDGSIRLFRCPAWPLVNAQDPTGAGDSYMGALAGYLTHCINGGHPSWEDMKRGVAIATVVAAAVCEKFGTVSLFALTGRELAERIERFRAMTQWN
ncbi:MAG: PfkB family carbohydrate kinase [Akkermansia sp.]|nr:PfkB family carbohydrate kinase [Akkermansia sp.]